MHWLVQRIASLYDLSLSICDPKTVKNILFHAYTSPIYEVNA